MWVVILLSAGAFACEGDVPGVASSDAFDFLEADVVVINGEHTFTNPDGIRSAHLVFDTAYQWRDSTNTALRGVDLAIYQENGAERAQVTSRRGTLDARGERMVAQEDVMLLIPGDDRRLESGELHYDPIEERIWSDSSFTMIHQGRPFRGSSFTSDLEFQNFEASGSGNSESGNSESGNGESVTSGSGS